MKLFHPTMINLTYTINVPSSAGGAIRQVNADGGFYHAIGTELYFMYDPIEDKFYSYDTNMQIPGNELTQEQVLQYQMEPWSPWDI